MASYSSQRVEDVDFSKIFDESECREHHADIPLSECLSQAAQLSEQRKQDEQIEFTIIIFATLIVLCSSIYFLRKKREKVGREIFDKNIYSIGSAWLIWSFAVLGHSYLFETSLVNESGRFLGWLVLPPVLVLLLLWWRSKFTKR